MTRHSPSSDEDDESWDEVPLRCAISFPTQPNTSKSCSPPNYSHCSVLNIVRNPWSSPSMFGKGIDTSPCCNDRRIEEFLGPSSLPQPHLSDKHDDCKKDTVTNECTAHNKMSKTLTKVVITTE